MSNQQESKLAWILALAAEPKPDHVAETHAVVIGLLCAKPDQEPEDLARHLAALQVGDWSSEQIMDQIGSALQGLREELASSDLRFQPLLPSEDRSLKERTDCLAHWCSGFLTGFGAGQPSISGDEAREALQMLGQIARAATDSEVDQEAEESAYVELVEFVRIAVLLLREDNLTRS